jgi:hypothetical protein
MYIIGDNRIYKLLKLVRANRIEFREDMSCQGESSYFEKDGRGEESFNCTLNSARLKGEFDEILTILHELIHYLPEIDKKWTPRHNVELEKEIDDEALRILNSNPSIANFLLSALREAKALAIRRSVERPSWVYFLYLIEGTNARVTVRVSGKKKSVCIKGGIQRLHGLYC